MEAVLTNGVDCVALVTEILLSKLKKGWRIYLIRTYTYWHIKRLITTWIYICNICKIQSGSIPIEVEGRIEYSVIKSFIPEFDRPFFEKRINWTRIKRESHSTCQYRQQWNL